MPQLIPFYFINEVSFTFVTLIALIFIFSKFFLPNIVRLFSSRVFITRL